ncbi:MAG TPA: hypothetical protein VEA69_04380 [Tepidisphaeraceae bacterium]|nr:hypothetical protein [Tepidisphaeraceae bacterium]
MINWSIIVLFFGGLAIGTLGAAMSKILRALARNSERLRHLERASERWMVVGILGLGSGRSGAGVSGGHVTTNRFSPAMTRERQARPTQR